LILDRVDCAAAHRASDRSYLDRRVEVVDTQSPAPWGLDRIDQRANWYVTGYSPSRITSSVSVPGNSTTRLFSGLTPGWSWHFAIHACSAVGCSAATPDIGCAPANCLLTAVPPGRAAHDLPGLGTGFLFQHRERFVADVSPNDTKPFDELSA
jgi:hypothetical protein